MAVAGVLRNYCRVKIDDVWVKNPVPVGQKGIRPMIAGNWKMNPSRLAAAVDRFTKTGEKIKDVTDVDVLVAPPSVYLERLQSLSRLPGMSEHLSLGAQNLFPKNEGAFTGEISPLQLRDLGVMHVIVGHSERRARFGGMREIIEATAKRQGVEIATKKMGNVQALSGTIQKYVDEALALALGETDQEINRKVTSALGAGLFPILCVGETLGEEREIKPKK